jgi:hypothetical protein
MFTRAARPSCVSSVTSVCGEPGTRREGPRVLCFLSAQHQPHSIRGAEEPPFQIRGRVAMRIVGSMSPAGVLRGLASRRDADPRPGAAFRNESAICIASRCISSARYCATARVGHFHRPARCQSSNQPRAVNTPLSEPLAPRRVSSVTNSLPSIRALHQDSPGHPSPLPRGLSNTASGQPRAPLVVKPGEPGQFRRARWCRGR